MLSHCQRLRGRILTLFIVTEPPGHFHRFCGIFRRKAGKSDTCTGQDLWNFGKNLFFSYFSAIIVRYHFCIFRENGLLFLGGIFLKRNTKTLLCVLCAVAAVLCVAAACFVLTKKQRSTPASSAASGASVSAYGKVSDFDYANFDYSNGLDDNGYWSGIRALDYVSLPDTVTALPLSKADVEPTEAEIQTQIDTLLNQYATTKTITDRAAQSGDTVNIDYSGAVDGVAFTGGTATGYNLTLGSHTFIDGFEDQIIGHNVGDTFDVTVTFPEGYGDSTDAEGNTLPLSGREAVFSVTVNAITQSVVPTLTDEWVASNFAASDDLHTADALRQYFDRALYASNLDNAVMDYLLNNSTFKDVPTQITNYYICMFLNYHSQLASQYGMDLQAYAQAKGYADADAMLADSDAYFAHLAKQDLLFQAIAETLDIAPTQEQIDSANASYADTYGPQRSMLNALQLAVLDKVEESVVLS